MAFDGLKDSLKEQVGQILSRIRESSLWNKAVEKFQDQPPSTQKLILVGGAFLATLLVMALPWYFYSSSSDQLEQFEAKKETIREAFRVARASTVLPPNISSVSVEEIRSAIQGAIATITPPILPEQTITITNDNSSAPSGTNFPKGLTQLGVSVQLRDLNLDQVVKIGARLQSLKPNAKLVGMKVISTSLESNTNHYFDATFKIMAFNLPPEPASASGAKSPPGKTGGKPQPTQNP